MFASTDFFHFVFANRDDEYYTSSLLKMDFDTYLWYCLRRSGYQCIANVRKVPNSSEYVMEMTRMTARKIETAEQPVKFWGSLFNRNNNAETQNNEQFVYEYNTAVQREKSPPKMWSSVRECIANVLNFMQSNSHVALVMQIDDFYTFCENKDNVATLVSMRKDNRSNIMVLCAGVNAAENDKYFVDGLQRYNPRSRNETAVKSIFFDKKLFPELAAAFQPADMEKLTKMVVTYDLLQKALGGRMMVWNKFSYNKVLNVVRYKFMRAKKEEIEDMCPPEFAAFVIQAWYCNERFRSKYKYNSVLDSNKTRLFSELAYEVGKRGFMRWIKEIYLTEQTYDVYKLKQRWIIDDMYSYIGYFSDSRPEPGIVQQMFRYREILLQQHYNIGEEKMNYLVSMIKFFKQPSYVSANNRAELPHSRFEDLGYVDELNRLYRSLSHKKEWNEWDDGCIEILFTLFDLCKDHAESYCGSDSFNEIGEIQMTEGMELIRYCMEQSVERYFDHEQACKTCNEAVDILYSGSKDKIRTIRLTYCI